MSPTKGSRLVAIFTAMLESPEQLKEIRDLPQIGIRIVVSPGAQFLDSYAIPSVIDMLGFTTNNGPLGFAYLLDPEDLCAERLVVLVKPDVPIEWFAPYYGGEWRGLVQMLGGPRVVIEFYNNVFSPKQFGIPVLESVRYTPVELKDLLR